MKVVYQKLFDKLKKEGITQMDLRKAGIGSSSISKMKYNQSITTDTICKICEFLHCMPDEILEWIPDSDFDKANEERRLIEDQIKELQAKLKKRMIYE